jgi:hypothetical protein
MILPFVLAFLLVIEVVFYVLKIAFIVLNGVMLTLKLVWLAVEMSYLHFRKKKVDDEIQHRKAAKVQGNL